MVKIAINRKQLIIFIVIIVCVAVVARVYLTLPRPITTYNLDGLEFKFRADLRQANNIPVYPDEEAIRDIIWNPEIQTLTIAYVNSSDNTIVAANAFEITYKLKLIYLILNLDVNITGEEVNSYSNLTATSENPIIALIPPIFTSETLVKVEDNIIYIKAKTYEEFDLTTVKVLMVALNISV